ncbi:MAG: trehalose-phosphatase [Corynebacterium sp.]|nr:trehalose-phosphatase [Corynebacterium sp.]
MIPVDKIAEAENLLLISDFDGTLAEFAVNALEVRVNQQAITALQQLAAVPGTHVALLSGRKLSELRTVSGLHEPVIFAGSHGEETSASDRPALNRGQRAALDQITLAFEELITDIPGAYVEHKPFHRVLHYRGAAPTRVADLEQRASQLKVSGVQVHRGKMVFEASVTDYNKGSWIEHARSTYGEPLIVFLGDDRTDEDGFAVLRPGDYGIKVGAGATQAAYRLNTIPSVGDFLHRLAAARS